MNQRLDQKRNDSLSIGLQQYAGGEQADIKQLPQDGSVSTTAKAS